MTIDVSLSPAIACGRCGGELYLLVTAPHPQMPGNRQAGLCPRCDAGRDEAQALLAYFAVHGRVETADVHLVADLIQQWLNTVSAHTDGAVWAEEYRQWCQGAL